MEQNIHIHKKSHHYLIYSTEFFFISMELKNSFRLLKQKETPQNFKLVKSQTYKMIWTIITGNKLQCKMSPDPN